MRTTATLAAPLVLAALAGAQVSVSSSPTRLVTFTTSLDPGVTATAHAQLTGAPGTPFKLFVAPHHEAGFNVPLSSLAGEGVLDADGYAFLEWPLSGLQAMPAGSSLDYLAVLKGTTKPGGKMGLANRYSNVSEMPLGAPHHCQDLDFDFTIGPVEPEAGQLIDDEWASIGLNVWATNNVAGHPDKAIVFDSSNPTGDDTDLATPGPGPGNTTALGNLLIVAENDTDADLDGFVDDPDDETGGGWLAFGFDVPVQICSTKLVDIDDSGPTRIVVNFVGGGPPAIVFVPNAGENSVQTVGLSFSNVASVLFAFGGSGAVANVGFVPCPSELSLGEGLTGKPTTFRAGEVITDQFFEPLGITVSADNNHVFPVQHPDKALVFDTAEPTGEDEDLATPGLGNGNTAALGKVMVIAEDDVDMNADGFVDDPDDEAFGGVLRFDFDTAVTFLGGTVLDIDTNEGAFFRLLDENDQTVFVVPLANAGDNSVQVVDLDHPVPGVHAVELVLSGSGAIARLRWCPPGVHDDLHSY
jgi:hypothetical protein